ncbi:hypothetical protein K0M31_012393, partial [Melipona bicolor]
MGHKPNPQRVIPTMYEQAARVCTQVCALIRHTPIVSSSVSPFAFLARVSLPGSPRARHLPGLHAARPRHEKFRLPARPTPLPSFRGGRSLTNCRYTYRPTSQPAE